MAGRLGKLSPPDGNTQRIIFIQHALLDALQVVLLVLQYLGWPPWAICPLVGLLWNTAGGRLQLLAVTTINTWTH